ncbi:MAG: hypothetical protein KIH65_004935 [Candidatus Uhrbacteria bacterium]|nr:hypothetical protein [Candidatus Uhrbacteria bacterium]
MYPYVFVPEQLFPPFPPLRLRRILVPFAIGLLVTLIIDCVTPGLLGRMIPRDDIAFIGAITLYTITFGPKEIFFL